MPACIVLLFYRNHFIDVYCHMFITTRVTLEFMSQGSREYMVRQESNETGAILLFNIYL